jgi:hypothetical protein
MIKDSNPEWSSSCTQSYAARSTSDAIVASGRACDECVMAVLDSLVAAMDSTRIAV